MSQNSEFDLYQQVIDILPTPVLIKDKSLRYIFINQAFEALFEVKREDIVGHLDSEVFKQRQVSQCNGGDLRVFATGEIDEAYESIFNRHGEKREVITRKNRLILPNGETYLVGTIHDITEVSQINQQLVTSQRKLQYQSKQLEMMATTDPLTGCDNRRCLNTKLPVLFKNQRPFGGVLALDIDYFKRINDTYGHQVGDQVLTTFTDLIRSQVGHDTPFLRMGGEEFLLAFPGQDFDKLHTLAEKLRASTADYQAWLSNEKLTITVSIGLAHSAVERELEHLILQADQALYQAKAQGRNQVVYTSMKKPAWVDTRGSSLIKLR